MSDHVPDHRARDERTLRCAACGTPYRPGDRFCAECGAALPEGNQPPPAAASDGAQNEASPAWVLGARPATVIVGGVALLLLAALLLAVGQRDETGTIVMLSICTAPLGLLALLIGIARYVGGASRKSKVESRE